MNVKSHLMNKSITLIVADDHPLLLKGLVDELKDVGYSVLMGAENGIKALEAILKHQPTIAILDIEMPLLSGFEVIKKATEEKSPSRFVILTSHKEKVFIAKAKKMNVSGYLLKDEPFSEINNCLKEVAKGGEYFSKEFEVLLQNLVTPQLKKIKLLSPSERTIVRLIAQEKTTPEIADLLTISPRTVQKHRANIISKLDLSPNMDSLSLWAIENKELLLSL